MESLPVNGIIVYALDAITILISSNRLKLDTDKLTAAFF